MEESGNKLVLVLLAVILLLVIVWAASCSSAHRQRIAREKEMSARFDIEDKLGKLSRANAGLQEELKGAQKKLADEKAAREECKKALMQEQMITQSLKDEIEKLVRQKALVE